MAVKPQFNFEEAMHGVLETRTALERALADMDRLEQLLTQRPAAFAPLTAATFRLRDRLIEDLETLEARLVQAMSGNEPPPDPDEPDRHVPLGDAVALGGQ